MMSAFMTTPYSICMPQPVLDALRLRLSSPHARHEMASAAAACGIEPARLRALVVHWLERFDWRSAEKELNRCGHHRVTIDGVSMHYVHVAGVGAAPLPIVIEHDWPWSLWYRDEVLQPLAQPAASGGDAADAFHVIALSPPGPGWPDVRSRWSPRSASHLRHTLMTRVLGHERYAVVDSRLFAPSSARSDDLPRDAHDDASDAPAFILGRLMSCMDEHAVPTNDDELLIQATIHWAARVHADIAEPVRYRWMDSTERAVCRSEWSSIVSSRLNGTDIHSSIAAGSQSLARDADDLRLLKRRRQAAALVEDVRAMFRYLR